MHHGGASFRLNDNATLAATILYVDYGQIDGYDVDGASIGNLEANDLAASLSLGHRFGEYFSAGITGKYIGQRLDDMTASAFAADLGVRADFGTIAIGATMANVGTKIKFEQIEETLPRTARAGLAVRLMDESLLLATEYEHQFFGNSVIHNGAEFNLDQRYFIRAGFFTSPEADSYIGSGLTFGAGALISGLKLDYAYSGSENLGSADLHRFSLSYFLQR